MINLISNDVLLDSKAKRLLSKQLSNIAKEKGLGIATTRLYEQGILSGWLQESTESLFYGERSVFTNIAVRKIRANIPELIKSGIFTDPDINFPEIIHRNEQVCFFCSSPRLTPKQVLFDYTLSNGNIYQCGFTFAPFGKPKSVFHHVMWRKYDNNYVEDMGFYKHTISDLVDLVVANSNAYNKYSENNNFVVDGFFNGWAGNSIFHQHFQFASFDNLPIREAVVFEIVVDKDDFKIEKLDWPTTVYRIEANSVEKLKEVSTTLGMLWKKQHDVAIPDFVKYMNTDIRVNNHTQNIYVPGNEKGRVVYFFLRYRSRGNAEVFFDDGKTVIKNNLAVIEMVGRFIIDDDESFAVISELSIDKRDLVMQSWLSCVDPIEGVCLLEENISNIYRE